MPDTQEVTTTEQASAAATGGTGGEDAQEAAVRALFEAPAANSRTTAATTATATAAAAATAAEGDGDEAAALKSKAEKAEKFGELLEYFEKQGLDSAEAVKHHLAQEQSTRTAQAELATARAAQEDRLTKELQARINEGHITAEAAEEAFEREMEHWQVKQDLAGYRQERQETEISRAIAQHPQLKEMGAEGDLMVRMVIASVPGTAPAAAAAYLEKVLDTHGQRLVSAHQAKQNDSAAKAAVPPGAGAKSGGAPVPTKNSSWKEIFGIGAKKL
jgi:hypothetical protein